MVAPVNIGDVVAEKYLVERVLGKGGMGVVYVAKHLQLGERVAIKFLKPKTLENEELVARFLREGRTAARLRSEYVARVRDVGTMPDGAPYLVMEYLDGRDFDAVLAEHGALDPAVAVKYVLQACEALAEAHSIGIIHRDLKPANLILIRKRDGTTAIKIIDFGISKLISSEGAPGMTQAAVMMGSPLYMAPEQMASARDADARSDVFSLGAILYHLLTGKPPFLGSSAVDVFERITQGPPSPQEVRPELPEGIEIVTSRCLRKARAERFPDVAALAAALVPFGPPHAQLFAESAERILRAAAPTGEATSLIAPSGMSTPSPVRLSSPLPPKVPDPVPGTTAKKAPPLPANLEKPRKEEPKALLDVLFEMEKERPHAAASEPPARSRQIEAPPREGPPESAPPPAGSPLAPAGRAAADALISAVREALSGFGLAGTVVLEGRQLTLHGKGAPTSIDAGPATEQWPLLPLDMQRRKALDLARRLAEAHRMVQQRARSGPLGGGGESSIPWGLVGKVLFGIGAAAAVVVGARAYLASRREVPLPPPVPVETREQESRRLATACRAVRERIYSGATIGPFDTTGWVVELWLSSRPGPLPGADAGAPSSKPISRESLASAVDAGRLAPRLDDALGQLTDGTLVLDEAAIPATSPGWTGVTLRFGGGYARAFFEPEKRTRFLAVADRLFESSGADLGALYARCAESPVHDVGAWFRGRDPGAAATALLWGVGMFAERPQINRAELGSAEIDGLRSAATTARLDAPTLKGLIGEQGGGLVATPGAVILAFPLGGPVRAVRASRAVATKIGIGRD
jgi:eukaryotic-like serine/threonine-protein kinase